MCILIVDDEPSHLMLLTTFLEAIGYAAVTAQNGQEALSYLHSTADLPGLILLDVAMPSMTGWDFLRVQQHEPRLAAIPVVVMTALGPLAHRKVPASVVAFLDKPIDLSDLEHPLGAHDPPPLQTRAVGL